MKLGLSVIFAIAVSIGYAGPVAAKTIRYLDTSTNITWTLEVPTGAPIHNWRPLPEAHMACPDHYAKFVATTRAKGRAEPFSREERERGDKTWHMECLTGKTPPVVNAPAPGSPPAGSIVSGLTPEQQMVLRLQQLPPDQFNRLIELMQQGQTPAYAPQSAPPLQAKARYRPL